MPDLWPQLREYKTKGRTDHFQANNNQTITIILIFSNPIK